jgi:hypothetical protein
VDGKGWDGNDEGGRREMSDKDTARMVEMLELAEREREADGV